MNNNAMKINTTIKSSLLTEDDAINIKGGINSQSVAIASSCTDCNCWFGNENTKEKEIPVKQSTQITKMTD
jgi:hypothetical protein